MRANRRDLWQGGPGARAARRRGRLVLLALVVSAAARPAPVDLDVGIPPGSPTEWGRAFPAITPSPGPLFPRTPSPQEPLDPNRTRSAPARAELEIGVTSSFGIVRILTWDLAAHMTWISAPRSVGPTSGTGAGLLPLPVAGEPLYWITLAPLLRLLLHPALASEAGTVAHLVELGTPSLGVLTQARQEKGLRPACDAIEERVMVRKEGSAALLEGETARENMLARFVRDELLAAYPYDPEGAFGQRVFILGDEVQPLVDAYASSKYSLLRRNATSALGRYAGGRVSARLVELAAQTDDPVVLARACAALGPQGRSADTAPLVKRLKRTNDLVERVILIGALGRLGERDAATEILRIGVDARHDKGEEVDVLLAVLEALARIRAPEQRKKIDSFLTSVQRSARSSPKRFQAPDLHPSEGPDVRDSASTRGLLVYQLALAAGVLQARDEDQIEELLDLLPRDIGGAAGMGRRGDYLNLALGEIKPRAMPLVIDALALCGEPGQERLGSIARAQGTEPSLRGRALALLPSDERRALASALVADGRDEEVVILALQVMVRDRHSEFAATARDLLARTARADPDSLSPQERYQALLCVRGLEEIGALRAEDLVPMLVHAQGVDAGLIDGMDARQHVRVMARALVELTAERARKSAVREQLDGILDLVVEARLNRQITEETRGKFSIDVLGMLDGVAAHRRDDEYKRAVAESIGNLLVGAEQRSQQPRARAEFAPPVPLETEVILALGRTREAAALSSLRGLLDNRRNAHRSTALLALGMAGHASVARDLCPFLVDGDAFTRFCAYESLRHLTGEDYFVDWMYGELGEWSGAAERYFQWTVREPR